MSIGQLTTVQRKVLGEILYTWLEAEMTEATALELLSDLDISKSQLRAYLIVLERRTNTLAEDAASEGREDDSNEHKTEARRIHLFMRTL